MRDTFPPAAGTLFGAGWPRGPKPAGGRPLPCRRGGGGGVDGGEKNSSLELDATTTAGVTALTTGLDSGGGEAELSDESGVGGRVRRAAAALVIILDRYSSKNVCALSKFVSFFMTSVIHCDFFRVFLHISA